MSEKRSDSRHDITGVEKVGHQVRPTLSREQVRMHLTRFEQTTLPV